MADITPPLICFTCGADLLQTGVTLVETLERATGYTWDDNITQFTKTSYSLDDMDYDDDGYRCNVCQDHLLRSVQWAIDDNIRFAKPLPQEEES